MCTFCAQCLTGGIQFPRTVVKCTWEPLSVLGAEPEFSVRTASTLTAGCFSRPSSFPSPPRPSPPFLLWQVEFFAGNNYPPFFPLLHLCVSNRTLCSALVTGRSPQSLHISHHKFHVFRILSHSLSLECHSVTILLRNTRHIFASWNCAVYDYHGIINLGRENILQRRSIK